MFSKTDGATLAKKLKEIRKAAGYTRQEIADILNLNRTTYTKTETGESYGSIESIFNVSELLRVSVETLSGTENSASGIKMDFNDIRRFEAICNNMGISSESAINGYVKYVIRNKSIPFEIPAEG